MATANGRQVLLKSNDGRVFHVDLMIAKMFKSIEALLESAADDNAVGSSGNETMIPLQKVDGAAFELILEWCEHHREANQEQLDNNFDADYCEEWDGNFLEGLNKEAVFAVVNAAYNLGIPRLVNISCKFIASMIQGQSPAELREFFHGPSPSNTDWGYSENEN